MRFSLLALISVSALAQSYFSFGEGFSLREGEDRLQVSPRMHTAPSLTEFSQAGILVDWLAVYPSEIRITVGEAYALSQLKVTAYGPAGTVKEHIPLTFGLEGPGDLLDFEDWRVHGDMKIKYRESFRPFAPSVLSERVSDYFDQEASSPYMLIVAPVREELRIAMTAGQEQLFGIDKLNVKRSTLPAITHVDYSARVQTVHESTNPRYHQLLKAFDDLTGCGVVVNTSFNVRGEPIVCTPEDAYRCFMRTEMDYLVLENFLLAKTEQPEWEKDDSWKDEFELD